MEQLRQLLSEYIETNKRLALPLSLDDLYELKEQSIMIRAEAKALAKRLSIPEPSWSR